MPSLTVVDVELGPLERSARVAYISDAQLDGGALLLGEAVVFRDEGGARHDAVVEMVDAGRYGKRYQWPIHWSGERRGRLTSERTLVCCSNCHNGHLREELRHKSAVSSGRDRHPRDGVPVLRDGLVRRGDRSRA